MKLEKSPFMSLILKGTRSSIVYTIKGMVRELRSASA